MRRCDTNAFPFLVYSTLSVRGVQFRIDVVATPETLDTLSVLPCTKEMQSGLSSLVELMKGGIGPSDALPNKFKFLKFICDKSSFDDSFCTHSLFDIRPDNVYVRKSYKELWRLSRKEKMAIVKGNPGVGKSVFMLYCIKQLVRRRQSFAFSHGFHDFFVYVAWEEESQDESQCKLELDNLCEALDYGPTTTNAEPVQSDHDIKTSDLKCKGSKEAAALEPKEDDVNEKLPAVRFFGSFLAMYDDVNKRSAFLLIDSSGDQVPYLSFADYKSTLICSSPDVAYRRLHDFYSTSLYMPVWPLSETAFSDEGGKRPKKRFGILGGIPRYLFASKATVENTVENTVKKAGFRIKTTSDLVELPKDFISRPHRQLEICDKINYRKYDYNIAPEYVDDQVFDIITATVLVDRVLKAGITPMISVAGKVHEKRFRFFMSGAVGKHIKFSARPLVVGNAQPLTDRIFDIELTSLEQINKLSEHLDKELEEDSFVQPAVKTFPATYFFVTPNFLFQPTVGENHSIKPERVWNILKAIRNRYGVNEVHLIYVVAHPVLSIWEKKKAQYDADEEGFFSSTTKQTKSGNKKARMDLTIEGFTLKEYVVSVARLSCADSSR